MNDMHYAVVVGINRYPGIRDLRHARSDARAFREWLVSPSGGMVPARNVRSVLAKPSDEKLFKLPREAQPTAGLVNDALFDVTEELRQRVRKDVASFKRSRLYVYASGHGIAPANGTGAVLMADANAAQDAYGYNIEISLYSSWFVACGWFSELVFFADCCRDRMFNAPGMGPPWGACPNPFGETNVVTGFATTFAASAFEPTDVKNLDQARGYFTRALLDGLQGGAADPNTGRIDTNSLAPYVMQSVEALTARKQFKQNPNIVGDVANPIVFRPAGSSTARQRRQVTISFPAGFRGGATLQRGDLTTVKHWKSVGRLPKTLRLDEGFYLVVPDPPAAPDAFKNGGTFQIVGKDENVKL
ncbi:MAG TPA: caspase family protein [Gaiellaceae bacterium]|jgi:uncharacterized caspase-like protein|nr:caspase family protein [Gaiellaceae bacterium]